MIVVVRSNKGPKTPEEKVVALRKASFAFRIVAAALLLVDVGFLLFSMEPPLAITIIPAVFLLVAVGLSIGADRINKS